MIMEVFYALPEDRADGARKWIGAGWGTAMRPIIIPQAGYSSVPAKHSFRLIRLTFPQRAL